MRKYASHRPAGTRNVILQLVLHDVRWSVWQ